MLANITELRTSVRYLINETTEAFWTDTFIDLMLNEGSEEFSSRTQCLSKFYSHTLISADIKNNREIRLNADFIAFDEGGVIYDGEVLIPTTMKELDTWAGNDWRDETGAPTHFYQRGDMLGFAPGRPAANIVVKYYAVERAPTLTGTVVALSGDYRIIGFRRFIRDYAVAHCHYIKGNKDDYILKMAEFAAGVRRCNDVVFGGKNKEYRMIPAHIRNGRAGINTDALGL